MNADLRIGVIIKTHGIRGEVKVYPTTESPERFSDLDEVLLVQGQKQTLLEVERARYFKNLVILKFKGFETIESIEPYINGELYIDREHGIPLEEGEYYIADLIGLKVVDDEGREHGTLKDVLETGANDVYIVSRKGMKDLLLPAIDECILDIDLDNEVMTVHMMDGLLDLYN